MQPSCFLRKGLAAIRTLDESIHIAMDLDLWFKIARQFRFVRTSQLLSSSLLHSQAKTSAFRNLTIVDTAIVIMRHGGEEEARKWFEEMARNLSYYESNFRMIVNHPVAKLLSPLRKILFPKRVRRNYVIPNWATQMKSKEKGIA
jgi:hypothetical protein